MGSRNNVLRNRRYPDCIVPYDNSNVEFWKNCAGLVAQAEAWKLIYYQLAHA